MRPPSPAASPAVPLAPPPAAQPAIGPAAPATNGASLRLRAIGRLREHGLAGRPLEWRLRSDLVLEVAGLADWILYSEIFVDAEYDPAIRHLLARTADGRVPNVLDLGANVGFFALRLADLMIAAGREPAELTLVEGAPGNVATLRRRIGANPAMLARTRIVHGLAGAREGTATIYSHGFHAASSIANPVMRRHGRGHAVGFVDLDALTAGMPVIDLLKCDIEGAEAQFLETYPELLTRVRAAVFELHPDLCDVPACRSRLAAAGLVRTAVLREAEDQSVELFARPG